MRSNKKTFAIPAERRKVFFIDTPFLRQKFTPPGMTESGFFVAFHP